MMVATVDQTPPMTTTDQTVTMTAANQTATATMTDQTAPITTADPPTSVGPPNVGKGKKKAGIMRPNPLSITAR